MKWVTLKQFKPDKITPEGEWIDVKIADRWSRNGYSHKWAHWNGDMFLPACCKGYKKCCNEKYGEERLWEWLMK
jgi:hypothetical protein